MISVFIFCFVLFFTDDARTEPGLQHFCLDLIILMLEDVNSQFPVPNSDSFALGRRQQAAGHPC